MTESDSPIVATLKNGEIELLGRITWSSNGAFLVQVTPSDGPTLRGIYKPVVGERPLFDFPAGLGRRETAAWQLGRALGWDLVPETVMVDGPLGPGSLQHFIDVDYQDHYFTILEDGPESEVLSQLRRLCCFDLLANNTDRKSGHCLIDSDRHIWAIDNALCFHAEFKLRTVIWDFAGEPIDTLLLDDIESLLDLGLPESLDELLDPFERDGIVTRARAVINERVFPHDPTGRRYPWPLV